MTTAVAADWLLFGTLVAVALALDILVARRGGRTPSGRSSALWSAFWIGLGLLFGGYIAWRFGSDAGLTYLTAYLLEKSLSVDNLFLFVLIFAQTGIPPALQHRALFWGVLGALAMRAVMIAAGIYLLERFHWVIYPFVGLLVFAAWRMLFGKAQETKVIEASCAICTSWVGRIIPIRPTTEGTAFLVREGGRWVATPLLVALVVIETTDLVFALDSIPAVFAVTRDPFLVYTSNVFALLGLRSLYFVLSGAIRDLRFLRTGLGIMLLFVAAKMLGAGYVEISPGVSLAVIALVFGVAIVASRLFPGPPAPTAEDAMIACTHLSQVQDLKPATHACNECVQLGDSWVHLRMCLTCGHVGCCDSSKNKHATAHFHSSGHPVMRSIEPGEHWKWCYVDQVMIE